MKKITAAMVVEAFDFKVANAHAADLSREISYPGIHRMGLELAGVYESSHSERQIIGWGTKEQKWLAGQTEKDSTLALKRALANTTPLLFLSQGIKGKSLELILHVASELGIPVVQLAYHLSDAIATVGSYLANLLAPSESVHGSLVIVYGVGVMITGKSGIGKSEAVLELVQQNHLFVSDDTVIITRIGNKFMGRGAQITEGYLESRGIGFINMSHLYGAIVVKREAPLDLVVELVPADRQNEVDRLGDSKLTYNVLGGKIPLIQIPVNTGRSVTALIKAATGVFIAKQNGHDSLKEFNERMLSYHGEE